MALKSDALESDWWAAYWGSLPPCSKVVVPLGGVLLSPALLAALTVCLVYQTLHFTVVTLDQVSVAA